MLQNVLFASALLVATAAVFANAEATCPGFSDAVDPFGLAMPTANCTTVTNCTMAQCTCNGGEATVGDNGMVQCTLGTVDSCDALDFCAQEYFWCLALSGGDDTCGDWSSQMKDGLLEILTEPATLNQSLLYRSCAKAACEAQNVTKSDCVGNFTAADICFPVKPTAKPLAFTRVPRLPGGVFAFPVLVISADLTFGGDFTLTFKDGNTSSRAKTMANTLFVELTNFLDYPVDVLSMFGGATGLKTTMEAVIPQSNAAKADDVFNRLNAKVSSRLFAAQDTLDFSQLTVANLRKRLAGAAGTAEPRCDTRCIAFIVIGIVVVVVVIIAAFLCTKKSNEVHGEKA